uniref:protein-disulfide reductase n=1 Tax=Nephromyces sp. MMRI TaxID=2496275 RepID=A0A3Q8UBS0_9APIC|nr:transposase [Nephromyces sp. MMRI]
MSSSLLQSLCGPVLRLPTGETTETSSIAATEIVGLYFSAHWCPPCRAFTPRLATVYSQAKQKGKSFEIIFVSLDRDVSQFEGYHSGMPWPAIPYNAKERQFLPGVHKVNSVPRLVFLNKTGSVINANANQAALQPSFIPGLADSVDFDTMIDNYVNALQADASLTNEKRIAGLDTVFKVLSNIINNPLNPKYMKLKKSNEVFKSKVSELVQS